MPDVNNRPPGRSARTGRPQQHRQSPWRVKKGLQLCDHSSVHRVGSCPSRTSPRCQCTSTLPLLSSLETRSCLSSYRRKCPHRHPPAARANHLSVASPFPHADIHRHSGFPPALAARSNHPHPVRRISRGSCSDAVEKQPAYLEYLTTRQSVYWRQPAPELAHLLKPARLGRIHTAFSNNPRRFLLDETYCRTTRAICGTVQGWFRFGQLHK